MSDAEIERTTIEIGHDQQTQNLTTVGEVIKFDGFLKVYGNTDAKAADQLPDLSQGDNLETEQISATLFCF